MQSVKSVTEKSPRVLGDSFPLVWTKRLLPVLIFALAAGYALMPPATADAQSGQVDSPPGLAPVAVSTRPLDRPVAPCINRFVAHDLDHVTTTADGVIRMFQANGTGMAAGDLDNDGDLDLVLGAEAGANSIFWNEGALRFARTELGQGPTRAVTMVDVDGDGLRDLVLTTNRGQLIHWRNQGQRTFDQVFLPGVAAPAYTLQWGDLDRDGDLDLVTGSYDAGFLTDLGNTYLMEGGSGIYVYLQNEGRFRGTRLAGEGQALALALLDVNEDHRLDILVGNDFAPPDYIFLQRVEDGELLWEEAMPFYATTHSTMSFGLGDVNNDGFPELFASDMMPYSMEGSLGDAYGPLMADMGMDEMEMHDGEMHGMDDMVGVSLAGMDPDMNHKPGDAQIMENVLQMRVGEGVYVNRARGWGVAATGWSWSSQFGDLDNDGYQDLYVVNGMSEETMFAHMPDHRLVEENQVFRNTGSGGMTTMPGWALNSTEDGRSMVMADLDNDGDLDIVVNNLRAPAQLFENRLCGGVALTVELVQPAQQNRHALGAQLALLTDRGLLYREIQATGGYLSGNPDHAHFGLPANVTIHSLEIAWPDGAVSLLNNVEPGQLYQITRNDND